MIRCLLACLTVLLVATGAAQANNATDAEETEEAQETQSEVIKTASVEKETLEYVPPRRGSPRKKVGGGVRAFGGQSAIPRALAPSHLASTQSASPTLYYHVDRPVPEGARIVLTVMAEDRIDPDLEIAVEPDRYPGFGRVRLADHAVELRQGVEYEWSVTVQLDPENPSLDPIDQGWIQRVETPASFDPGTATASDFAGQGLWYEALDRAFGADDRANDDVRTLLGQIDLEKLFQARPETPSH